MDFGDSNVKHELNEDDCSEMDPLLNVSVELKGAELETENNENSIKEEIIDDPSYPLV